MKKRTPLWLSSRGLRGTLYLTLKTNFLGCHPMFVLRRKYPRCQEEASEGPGIGCYHPMVCKFLKKTPLAFILTAVKDLVVCFLN